MIGDAAATQRILPSCELCTVLCHSKGVMEGEEKERVVRKRKDSLKKMMRRKGGRKRKTPLKKGMTMRIEDLVEKGDEERGREEISRRRWEEHEGKE